jgi:hypothetical protein
MHFVFNAQNTPMSTWDLNPKLTIKLDPTMNTNCKREKQPNVIQYGTLSVIGKLPRRQVNILLDSRPLIPRQKTYTNIPFEFNYLIIKRKRRKKVRCTLFYHCLQSNLDLQTLQHHSIPTMQRIAKRQKLLLYSTRLD